MKLFDSEPHVLFEDNHLLVVLKPAGWLAQRDEQNPLPDLENWAGRYRQAREGKPGLGFAKACHRLDVPVRGIVAMAKTSKAQVRMQQSQQAGLWKKIYLAHTRPAPEVEEGTLCDWLIQREGWAECVHPGTPGAKEAVLNFTVLTRHQQEGWLGVELLTGRYHQIRAQLAAHGFPICGDVKYGAQERRGTEGIDLFGVALGFPHPVTGKENWLTVLDPSDPAAWIDWVESRRPPSA